MTCPTCTTAPRTGEAPVCFDCHGKLYALAPELLLELTQHRRAGRPHLDVVARAQDALHVEPGVRAYTYERRELGAWTWEGVTYNTMYREVPRGGLRMLNLGRIVLSRSGEYDYRKRPDAAADGRLVSRASAAGRSE